MGSGLFLKCFDTEKSLFKQHVIWDSYFLEANNEAQYYTPHDLENRLKLLDVHWRGNHCLYFQNEIIQFFSHNVTSGTCSKTYLKTGKILDCQDFLGSRHRLIQAMKHL